MADKHGVAGGPDDHAEHGEPDVRHALWSLSPVADTQHVAHGFKEGEGVELAPGVVLQARKEEQKKKKSGANFETEKTGGTVVQPRPASPFTYQWF